MSLASTRVLYKYEVYKYHIDFIDLFCKMGSVVNNKQDILAC